MAFVHLYSLLRCCYLKSTENIDLTVFAFLIPKISSMRIGMADNGWVNLGRRLETLIFRCFCLLILAASLVPLVEF
jgi:hypothetical protein